MGKAFIDSSSYIGIIEQAAKNNGRAIVEVSYHDPLEIMIDVEFAKHEWANYERRFTFMKESPKEVE